MGMIMPINMNNMMTNMNNENTQDKIVKDQNFLSSDDKLFESVVNHGLCMKNVFSECQFSEKLLGSLLFKAVKKHVYDPNCGYFSR